MSETFYTILGVLSIFTSPLTSCIIHNALRFLAFTVLTFTCLGNSLDAAHA